MLHWLSQSLKTICCNSLQERDGKDIEIPNIKWDVFELMMR